MTNKTRVQNWKEITLTRESTFSETLQLINKSGYQLALVIDSDDKLIGIVTDSDVRKALLRGVHLEEQVGLVMNESPLVVSEETEESDANKLMRLNSFFHLPIVDDRGKLVGLHLAEQLQSPQKRSEALVIMAGGRGQRMMPLTANTPKPMLPLRGRPILQHIIERAKDDGFQRIVVSVNYLSEVIMEYFGTGSQFGVEISYLVENQPLGTAGALAQIPKSLRKNNLVITNADLVTDVAYSDLIVHAEQEGAEGLMAVRLQEWQNPFGVVHTNGNRLIKIEEKPTYRHHVNAGIYVLAPSLLDLLEEGVPCDMPQLFSRGIREGMKIHVFPIHEYWLDVGRPEDYESANDSSL